MVKFTLGSGTPYHLPRPF